MKKRIAAVITGLAVAFTFLIPPPLTQHAYAATTKTVTCPDSTKRAGSCDGNVCVTSLPITTCPTCGSTKSNYSWTCELCGATGSFSQCEHSLPSSDPTSHNSTTYWYEDYGYLGTEQSFTVYSVRVIDNVGCTAKLEGCIVDGTAKDGAWLTISISDYTGTYPMLTFLNDNNGSTIDGNIVLTKNGSYEFKMPAAPICIVITDQTSNPNTIYLGNNYMGPYAVWTDLYKGKLRVHSPSFYWGGYSVEYNRPRVYVHHCMIVSKGVKGTIAYSSNDGSGSYGPFTPSSYKRPEQYKYSDFSDVEQIICYKSITPCGSSYADVSRVQFTYTPSQEDVDNRVKYGSIDSSSGGTVTNWKTVTSTSPITVTCAYLAVVAPDFPGNSLDTTAVAQTITSTLSANTVGYGDTPPTLTVTGAKTALSYSSSNEAVATISSTGVITIVGVGDTTITIKAAETGEWLQATKDVTLTVTKGDLSIKTPPNASAVNYGQTLASSTLSNGITQNKSGNSVGGSYSWKNPVTVPQNAKTYIVKFVPNEVSLYNY